MSSAKKRVIFAISEALRRGAGPTVKPPPVSLLKSLADVVIRSAIEPINFFADAALAYATQAALGPRPADVEYARSRPSLSALRYSLAREEPRYLNLGNIRKALWRSNRALIELHELGDAFGTPVYETLGLRNLSTFVGETFKSQLCHLMKRSVMKNPVQDGYPDLMALTVAGKKYIRNAKRNRRMTDKKVWRKFPYGGIEIKATCCDTPVARKLPKPLIGESRLAIATNLTWKAHHRDTNRLLGLVWDFVDSYPTILAVCYCNRLSESNWGKVVVPKQGSHSTSVSIIKASGVSMMGANWLFLPRDQARNTRLKKLLRVKDSGTGS